MLHPGNPRIALCVGMDIHVSKETEERDPEDEEDGVDYPGKGNA